MNIINNIIVQEAEVACAAVQRNRPARRHIAVDPFNMNDKKFVKLFRLTKRVARNLIRHLTPYMKQRQRKSMLDIKRKVSIKHIKIIDISNTEITYMY